MTAVEIGSGAGDTAVLYGSSSRGLSGAAAAEGWLATGVVAASAAASCTGSTDDLAAATGGIMLEERSAPAGGVGPLVCEKLAASVAVLLAALGFI